MAKKKTNEIDGFLRIPVKPDHAVTTAEETLVQALNRKISPQDLYFSIEDGEICAYLAGLEPDSFRKTLTALREQTGLNEFYRESRNGDPFDEIMKRILRIGSYGIRYGKRVYIGYADDRKVMDRKKKAAFRGTHYYTRDHLFNVRRNPFPDQMINTIICGDSETILKTLPDNCVDLIITSPPYNFGLQYDNSPDGGDWDTYLKQLFRVLEEGIRVLAFGGRFIINIQPLFSDYIPLHHIISSFFMEKKMIWKGEILWEKNNYNCKYCSWGSWKSPSSPYLKYTWEFIEIFCKGDLKKAGRKEDIDITEEEFKNWVIAKWSIGPERRMQQYDHPAMFPEELVERCLKLFSYQNDLILDPFNGAGTTTAVASRTNRRFCGIDISPQYCETARRRTGIGENLPTPFS